MDAAIFGNIVADLIAEPMDLRHPPQPGALCGINSVLLTTGGNVCNVGMAMARLGMKVAAAGLIGSDALGATVLDKMGRAGVDTTSVAVCDRMQTSATIVAVEPGGERCFFHTPGVTSLLDATTFRNHFPLFARCRYVQIGYFGLLPQLTADLPSLLAELKALAPHVKIALDTVNPPAAPELLWPILPWIDLFCPSRTEAAILTGQSDPHHMAVAFGAHMKPAATLGIKLDTQGCYLLENGIGLQIPAYKIDVVDTTGAGDTWFGALLAGLIRGMPLAQAGHLANRAAGDCCTALGASAGVQSFEQSCARM